MCVQGLRGTKRQWGVDQLKLLEICPNRFSKGLRNWSKLWIGVGRAIILTNDAFYAQNYRPHYFWWYFPYNLWMDFICLPPPNKIFDTLPQNDINFWLVPNSHVILTLSIPLPPNTQFKNNCYFLCHRKHHLLWNVNYFIRGHKLLMSWPTSPLYAWSDIKYWWQQNTSLGTINRFSKQISIDRNNVIKFHSTLPNSSN